MAKGPPAVTITVKDAMGIARIQGIELARRELFRSHE
jgi:hypothetical protein